MYHVMLLFVAVLLGNGCRAYSVRQVKLWPEVDNNIVPNELRFNSSESRRVLTITQRPPEVSVHTPGSVLELTCEALGSPAPIIRWFKNDAPIYEYDMQSNELVESDPESIARATSILLVTHTTSKDKYTCIASSGQKTEKATSIVYRADDGESGELREWIRVEPLAPRVVWWYKAAVGALGRPAVLPCGARGHPPPAARWRDPRGRPLRPDTRRQVLRSGELVISHLLWSDMGEFTCTVSNVFGSSEVKTFLYPARPDE